jgi:hypothetical protein
MDTERKIFRNQSLNDEFIRNGYLIIDLLDAPSVKRIYDFFELNAPEHFEGTYSSVFFWNESLNKEISDLSNEIIQPVIQEYLNEWFLEGASFITKYPSEKESSDFGLHQDFNMLDEQEVPSIGLWIPLIDTHKDNGGLCVLPGSHLKFAGTIRGANLPSQYIRISPEVEKKVTFLDVKAGQACFFFHSLFHGSLNNSSKNPRVIMHAGLFPKNSVPIHYLEVSDELGNKTIEKLKFNRLDYYKNINAYLANPKSFPHEVIGIQEIYTPKPTMEEVLADYTSTNNSIWEVWHTFKKKFNQIKS